MTHQPQQEIEKEIAFLRNAQHVGDALCKNSAHSYGINFAKLNEFMLEVEKRLRDLENKKS